MNLDFNFEALEQYCVESENNPPYFIDKDGYVYNYDLEILWMINIWPFRIKEMEEEMLNDIK